MSKFAIAATVMVIAVSGIGIASQNVNDRTMENCTVDFASNPFNNTAQSSVYTSCGYVFVSSHSKNGWNPEKVIQMNEAIHSGQPLTIKGTGIGFTSAYEITVSK